MVRGERYMAHPVIPVGRVAQVTLRFRALPGTSTSAGRSKGKPPKEKGDNQTSKVARRQQRVNLSSTAEVDGKKGEIFQ